jgi:alkaline phosphatase
MSRFRDMEAVEFPEDRVLNGVMNRLIILFSVFIISASLGAAETKPLRGIVFVLSDGTSQELLTATRCYAQGAEGKLVMDSYPEAAFVSTYSLNDMVTDSAAAATAFSRGIKADNNVIGMATATSTNAPLSLLDVARKAGWSTGTITDDAVTGATPAPFEVECPSRHNFSQIAQRIVPQLGPRADIVLGGGNQWFHDMSATVHYGPGEVEIVRKTEEDLQKRPVMAFSRWEDFVSYVKDGKALQKPVLGTFFPDVFPFYADGTRTLRLKDMVEASLDLMLRDKRPFFLFIEAGLPDKAAHLNQAKRAIGEVLELDAMMDTLRKKLPKNVLVVATTDHNNGGFSMNAPVPRTMRGDDLLAINPISKTSTFSWASGPGGPDPATRVQGSTNDPAAIDHVQPAALYQKKSEHTGGDVWLVADGPFSGKFHGHLDNTDIYTILRGVMESQGKKQ